MLGLIGAEIRRTWILFVRYPLEALAVMVMLVLLFYGLFFGASYLAGPDSQFGGRLDGIVVGYVTWLLAIGVFSGIGGDIERESTSGTLEQVVLSRKAFVGIALLRAVANLAINAGITLVLLVAIVWMTGVDLSYPALVGVPIAFVLLSATGLGLMIGSITLLAKRTTALIGLAQFGLLFVILTPFEQMEGFGAWAGRFVPIANGAGLLRRLMAGAEAPTVTDYWTTGLSSALYLAIGIVLFHALTGVAKRRGTLAQY